MTQNGRIDQFDYEPGGCGTQALVYGIIIALILCFSGCKSIQYVPVVEHHTDTTYITKLQHDSIWQHDSIYVHEYSKGDTVYLELTKWHTKYIEKLRVDTMYEHKVDSVPVIHEVEKKLTAYQQMKMDYGGYAILLVILSLVFIIYKFVRKLLP